MADAQAVEVRVVAPAASSVRLIVFTDDLRAAAAEVELVRTGEDWVGAVPEGTVYGLVADGDDARFDPSKVLLDPRALDVVFAPNHDRQVASRRGEPHVGPLAVATHPQPARTQRRSNRPPVVYEAHVRGLTIDADVPKGGTYAGLESQLRRIAALGFSVLELMPVHQQDPKEGSYLGYMPLAVGAVHRQWAATDDAGSELADLVAAAHDHGVEVWLDVVFNHSTEVDAAGPTYSLRGLADGAYYRRRDDGSYIETTGCGNDLDAESPAAQDLVLWSLDRLADLGVDGFRFDLAAVLARSPELIDRLAEWAQRRGVVLVAEPWDAVGTYLLGRAWPGAGWMQWNDRFRDDVRGFLRGEPGMVPALRQRLQGSPDLFDRPMHSVNFVTCHDGLTLWDVFAFAGNRTWNCGWEGDDGVPAEVLALRHRQLRNAWCVLAMSHGVPMVAMGDELGRTQGGDDNPYDQDDETSWVDWQRAESFADLTRFVGLLRRASAPPGAVPARLVGEAVRFVEPDADGRAVSWRVGGLLVVANAWWEPIDVDVSELGGVGHGPWRRVVDTSCPPPDDILDLSIAPVVGGRYLINARTTVILERQSSFCVTTSA